MKECTECKYFNGWDYYDGTPNCEYKGGYEQCPLLTENVVSLLMNNETYQRLSNSMANLLTGGSEK